MTNSFLIGIVRFDFFYFFGVSFSLVVDLQILGVEHPSFVLGFRVLQYEGSRSYLFFNLVRTFINLEKLFENLTVRVGFIYSLNENIISF